MLKSEALNAFRAEARLLAEFDRLKDIEEKARAVDAGFKAHKNWIGDPSAYDVLWPMRDSLDVQP